MSKRPRKNLTWMSRSKQVLYRSAEVPEYLAYVCECVWV